MTFKYSFSFPPIRNCVRPAAVPGADALRVARHRPGLRGVLLPAGAAGGPRTDLVPDEEGAASGEPQPLASQSQGCFWHALDPWPDPACADGGNVH